LRLTLVRHGETVWNREKKIQGITDIELTELGIEQANKLSLSLQKENFDRIITSPLKRAYDTAQAIGRYHDVAITVENDLHEIDAGELEGLSYPDLLIRYPDFLRQWMIDHSSVAMPNGESLQNVQDRVWPVIKRIVETSRDALVVSHSFVIITVLCKVQHLNLSESAKIRLSVASKTKLEIENGSAQVISFNDTAHLRDD
jgi:phosphoserine phosphatase